MSIVIWDKDKQSSSLLNVLALETGDYNAIFDSNILTRDTILLVAKNQREPIYSFDHVITITKTSDDGQVIIISFHVERGQPTSSEAGFGKTLTIIGALGALGIITIVFLQKLEKTGGALVTGIPEFILENGLILLLILGVGILIWSQRQ